MAVVQECYDGNTHIVIRNDCYSALSPEQLEGKRKEAGRSIAAINMRAAVGDGFKKDG